MEWRELVARVESDVVRRANDPSAPSDRAVWEELMPRVRRYVNSYGSFLGGLPIEADDVVQDVLVKLQSPDTVRRWRVAGGSAGYLIAIIRNLLIDSYRKQRVERRWFDRIGAEHLMGELARPPDEAAVVSRWLERRLVDLGDDDRRLLHAVYWEGLSIREIADREGLKYSTVAVRLFRLLRRLRET